MFALPLVASLLLSALVSASSLAIQSARIAVVSSDGEQLRSEAFSIGKQPALITLSQTDALKLSFTVVEKESKNGVQPHQTFLRFYDIVTGEEGIQPVRVSSAGQAKFYLNVAKPPSTLPPTSSDPIHVSLLLGSYTHDPATIDLFDLTLPPSHPAPQHPEEETYHARPEIFHTFRPDPKSPNKAVSTVFSALVVAPWFLLITMWSSIPHKLPHLFSSKILPFVALLAAFEGLLLWYWVALKLFQVLAYGVVLAFFTTAAGKRALSAVAAWRKA